MTNQQVNFMNKIINVFLIVVCMAYAIASWAQLSTSADRTRIDSNETLELVVRYEGQVLSGEPDFSALQNEFEILSNNRQQQFSWVNGQSQSYTEWHLSLMPKHSGTLLIPSFSFKNQVSNALEIVVNKASHSGISGQAIFTETILDKESAYVQGQVLLTQRLYTSLRLSDLSLTDLNIDNTLALKVSENQFKKQINGKTYLVIEVIYALFPQLDGSLTIPGQRFAGYESNHQDPFGSILRRGKRIVRDTQSKVINILERPSQISADQWMPAKGVSISQEWSRDPDSLTVGEPVTRTIRIAAQGVTGAQILPLNMEQPSGLKYYPDQAQIEDRKNNSGILGVRTESLAIVPGKAGEMSLPAVTVHWWDTENHRLQTTRLASVTLNINAPTEIQLVEEEQPLTSVDTAAVLPAQGQEKAAPSTWLQLSLTVNALLLALLAGLLLMRRTSPHTTHKPFIPTKALENPTLKQRFKTIESFAREEDYPAMRAAILDWGRVLFPDVQPNTLKQLAHQLENKKLEELFEALDKQLFTDIKTREIDIETLLKTLKEARPARQKSPNGNALKPLYPTG